METEQIISEAKQLLSKGKLEQTLDFLESQKRAASISDEIINLKSKYHITKDDFEIRRIIDRNEYDLSIDKIVVGVQNLINKLSGEPKDSASYKYLLFIFSFILALIIYTLNTTQENHKVDAAELNFLGTWNAKVEHLGYTIQQGRKIIYLNSEANWVLELYPDHTAMMKATIDTTGTSRLDWYFNKSENRIAFIQEDEQSFEVDVISNDADYQKWTTERISGTKTENWIWTLKRIM